jgi:hypothetical protein
MIYVYVYYSYELEGQEFELDMPIVFYCDHSIDDLYKD